MNKKYKSDFVCGVVFYFSFSILLILERDIILRHFIDFMQIWLC